MSSYFTYGFDKTYVINLNKEDYMTVVSTTTSVYSKPRKSLYAVICLLIGPIRIPNVHLACSTIDSVDRIILLSDQS